MAEEVKLQLRNGYTGPLDFGEADVERPIRNQEGNPIRLRNPGGVISAFSNDANARTVHMELRNPGIYMDDHRRPIGEEEARRAGFDVDKWALERRAREREAQIDREMEEWKRKARAEIEARSPIAVVAEAVAQERADNAAEYPDLSKPAPATYRIAAGDVLVPEVASLDELRVYKK